MKKILILIVSVLLMLAITVPAFAAGTASISCSAPKEAKPGDTVTVTVSMSNCDPFKSMSLSPSYDSNVFELVSGEWSNMSDFMLSSFDGKNAAVAFKEPVTKSGTIFKLVLKVKNADSAVGSTTVTVSPVIKNGSEQLSAGAASATVKVVCAEHKMGQWATAKEATCTNKGAQERACTVCGYKESKDIDALGHKYGQWSQTTAPTCTAKGAQERVCSVCQNKETQDVAALGHKFGQWTTVKEPTCTEKGSQESVCTVCSAKETKDVNAAGHKYGNWKTVKEATCTEKGSQEHICGVCQNKETQEVKALGHKFSGWKATKPATCSEEGEQARSCSVCKEEETKKLAKGAHEFESPVVVKEATLSQTGLMEGKCKNCGEKTQQTIPCAYTDQATGITIQAENKVFASGTEAQIQKVESDELTNAMAEESGAFSAYAISFAAGEEEATPNGQYTMILPVDAAINSENIAMYMLDENGAPATLEFTLNDDGTVAVNADKAGTYIVADKSVAGEVIQDTEPTEEETEPQTEPTTEPETQEQTAPSIDYESTGYYGRDDGIMPWIVLGIMILLIIILIVILVVKYVNRNRY